MTELKRPNFRKQSCCGNCAHSFEEDDGALFCNVARDFPSCAIHGRQCVTAKVFAARLDWFPANIVFAGAVCDEWWMGEENQPAEEANP